MKFMLKKIWRNNLGAVATEYAFLIAFIAIVAATGMTLLGHNLSTFFSEIGAAMENKSDCMPLTAAAIAEGKSNKCK